MAVTVDFLSGLYDKYSCYADRLTNEEIEAIDVPGALEPLLRKWILGRKDIVLAGNPGDGKTHLLRRLSDATKKTKASVILDATAEDDYSKIVRAWKQASRQGRPFCLAINQGPLSQLIHQCSSSFDKLAEVQQQLGRLIYYDKPAKMPKDVFVVDLNLRSVLNCETIEAALTALLREDHYESCPDCFKDEMSDAWKNRRALQHPKVRSRLVSLLEMAARTGRHISMRDLQGFLSYIMFGGRSSVEMIRTPSALRFRYFNLCFSGEGAIFDAVRAVFDPVRATLPKVDEDLWENTGVNDGWLFGRPPLTPDHYDDAQEQFESLKRQYYFENDDGERLLGLLGEDDRTFWDLLRVTGPTQQYLPRVIKALNSFYCPGMKEDGQALRLWAAQQYDDRSPKILVSCYCIASGKFSLQLPEVVPWLREALGYQRDHVLLQYQDKQNEHIGLRIDRGLWHALMLAAHGMPFALRSPQYAQALRMFVTRLHRVEAKPQPVESVVLYDLANNERMRVYVDREKGQYIEL